MSDCSAARLIDTACRSLLAGCNVTKCRACRELLYGTAHKGPHVVIIFLFDGFAPTVGFTGFVLYFNLMADLGQ
jgi:hypothetical protein